MKVLLLTHHFFPVLGGIESYALGLAKALKENGIECSVVCLNKNPETKEKLAVTETIDGISVKRVQFLDIGFYKIAFGLLEEIKKADLVHVQNIGFLSDFALLTRPLHKKPVVINTHGGISHTKKRMLLKGIYSKWLGFLLKRADFVIADSNVDFEEFERKAKQIKMIENGVELEEFLSIKKSTRSDNFVFVGRISRNKRIDLLLDAFAIIVRERPKALLKIVGKDFDNILPELEKKCSELQLSRNVSFLKNASKAELLSALAESEFFVSASEFEGFGIAIVEAMAAGCIPLLNNIGAFKAFVEDGKNGFLIDFSNPKGAAEKMLKAMSIESPERKRLSGEARESVQKYSWKSVVKEIIEVYEAVLK